MDKAMPLTPNWHGLITSNFALHICMFFLINNINVLVSHSAIDHCILNVETSSSFANSSCNDGYWGGSFLNKNCSGGAFRDYIYALALRANQTGEIFLNPNELLKTNGSDCGMEKLMASDGGCSDFSTFDVNKKLGHKLERLKGKCGLKNDVDWGKSCGNCLRSWEEIKEVDYEICSFAVLITLVSTEIENELWASRIFNCLGNQHLEKETEVPRTTKRKKIRPGLCVLIGGIVGLFVVVIFSVLILSRRRKMPIAPLDKDAWRPGLSSFPAWKLALSALSKESKVLKVSIEEVHAATNNLHESNFIGEGTAGEVYRGVLSSNQRVAIKKITTDGCADTFLREIGSLMHIKHPNLVTLMGYCENGFECFLIYELCLNGNLSEWLYGKDKFLSWIQRLEIAIGSARGLRFLHTFPEGCIVHRDVKPTNILLGTNFEAKLSDFGLSKVMNLDESSVSSKVRGTFGYVDPEYQTNHHTSAASDIYSFGIVLFQILSGMKAINMNMKKPKPSNKIAKSVMKNGNMVGFADANLHGEYPMEAFWIIFELAILCTGNRRQRPSISEVIVKLEEALAISTRMEPSTPQTTPDWSKIP